MVEVQFSKDGSDEEQIETIREHFRLVEIGAEQYKMKESKEAIGMSCQMPTANVQAFLKCLKGAML